MKLAKYAPKEFSVCSERNAVTHLLAQLFPELAADDLEYATSVFHELVREEVLEHQRGGYHSKSEEYD